MLTSQTDSVLKEFQPKWLFAALAATAIFFFGACEDLGEFGPEVLPAGDRIETRYSDTNHVIFTSEWIDSTNTYRAARQLFGNYIDPDFGRITAETYTQVLPQSNLNFGDAQDLIFDSLVLKLNIESSYGRPATVQTLRIHPLTEGFPEGDTIFSTTRLAYDDSRDLGNGYQIDLGESEGVGRLTIRLDDDLGRRILFASPDTLGDKDLFQVLFPGLYLGTDPVTYQSREPGAIYSLFGSSDLTLLELHYKKRESGSQAFRPQVMPFLIVSSTPRFTHLSRTEVSDKLLAQALPQPDTAQELEFLQGGLLIRTFVKLPNLEELGQVAINQATLVLHVDRDLLGSDNRFAPPASIWPVFADSTGQPVYAGSEPVLASSAVAYNSTEGTYTIPLTNYTQQLVNGQRENYGLVLLPENPGLRINRVAIGGTSHPSLAPEFRVTYTTLPE